MILFTALDEYLINQIIKNLQDLEKRIWSLSDSFQN